MPGPLTGVAVQVTACRWRFPELGRGRATPRTPKLGLFPRHLLALRSKCIEAQPVPGRHTLHRPEPVGGVPVGTPRGGLGLDAQPPREVDQREQ